MAGSYGHVDPDGDGRWSLIENMGDAYECVEELLYLARCFADKHDIRHALAVFSRFKRGERNPASSNAGEFGRAYLETRKVMDQE